MKQIYPRISPCTDSSSVLGPGSPRPSETESEGTKRERVAKVEREGEAWSESKVLQNLGDNKYPDLENWHKEFHPDLDQVAKESEGHFNETMIDSGPVTTQYPTAVLSIPLSINGGRHSPVADQAYSRGTERPSLTALDTKTNLQKESEPYPNLGGIKHESFSGNSSILRPFYDPILDRSQPTLQRQQHKQDCKTSDGQTQGGSPESVRSLAAGIPLPPISQLDFGFISHVRSPGRHSPLSAYSSKSPMSLSQHFTSPHPSIGGSQPYHAIYSESSPASNHNTTSPRDQYTQAISSGSSTHYEGQIYRGTTGHTPMAEIRTPISASTQGAFSPMSNARSPTNDQRPFSQDEPSSPLHQSQLVPGGYQCMHEQCIDRPAFQTQYLLS